MQGEKNNLINVNIVHSFQDFLILSPSDLSFTWKQTYVRLRLSDTVGLHVSVCVCLSFPPSHLDAKAFERKVKKMSEISANFLTFLFLTLSSRLDTNCGDSLRRI